MTALLGGPAVAVDDMLAMLWRGPPAARVSNVAVEGAGEAVAARGFTVTG